MKAKSWQTLWQEKINWAQRILGDQNVGFGDEVAKQAAQVLWEARDLGLFKTQQHQEIVGSRNQRYIVSYPENQVMVVSTDRGNVALFRTKKEGSHPSKERR